MILITPVPMKIKKVKKVNRNIRGIRNCTMTLTVLFLKLAGFNNADTIPKTLAIRTSTITNLIILIRNN
ncbi:hypothetical protein EGI32_10280 [Ferruginibacter sp. HRS2-29]|nr:hypothetical protein [Ferruginibacter sp. HRS2-29]